MGRHRRRKGHARTGLIGASAALTVSAVAVGSGLLPGVGDRLGLNDSSEADDVRAQDVRSPARQTTPSPSPSFERGDAATEESSRDEDREPAEETTEAAEESAEPSPEETTAEPSAPEETTEEPTETESAAPEETTQEPEPEPTSPSPTEEETDAPNTDPETAAVQAVLTLVNQERARVGCQPLTLDTGLSRLAADFSGDMAERGFFDHTDPDGLTPWDRALLAGIINLGGENIARGQQDAEAVMEAWMSSEGHRENILNCAFQTLGVGVHLGDGGPWWTQDFGY